jgi:DNA mismatch endonuclease, patch repair protein
VDTLSKQERSENMRRIRSKNTQPELGVRRLVHAMGYRFRLHSPNLPGKPDLAFPRLKKIIEVRGCFWHQHGCRTDSHIPKSRIDFWHPKLQNNVKRDKQNLKALRKLGWNVLVVWECDVKPASSDILREKLRSFLARK